MRNIAFITKSQEFDSLIQAFRKSSINAGKKSVESDLSDVDVFIVDLGYPLDAAYPFLERINNDYRFSDKVVLSIISHKSQILKLRSFALGCDGYVSSSIEYSDLHKKIKEIDNPEKFLIKKDFSNIPSHLKIQGSLTHISENGCLLKSKVSFAAEVDTIDLKSRIFDELELSKKFYFTLSKSNPIAKRSFVTAVNFTDFTTENHDKVRKMIHSWSVK